MEFKDIKITALLKTATKPKHQRQRVQSSACHHLVSKYYFKRHLNFREVNRHTFPIWNPKIKVRVSHNYQQNHKIVCLLHLTVNRSTRKTVKLLQIVPGSTINELQAPTMNATVCSVLNYAEPIWTTQLNCRLFDQPCRAIGFSPPPLRNVKMSSVRTFPAYSLQNGQSHNKNNSGLSNDEQNYRSCNSLIRTYWNPFRGHFLALQRIHNCSEQQSFTVILRRLWGLRRHKPQIIIFSAG